MDIKINFLNSDRFQAKATWGDEPTWDDAFFKRRRWSQRLTRVIDVAVKAAAVAIASLTAGTVGLVAGSCLAVAPIPTGIVVAIAISSNRLRMA